MGSLEVAPEHPGLGSRREAPIGDYGEMSELTAWARDNAPLTKARWRGMDVMRPQLVLIAPSYGNPGTRLRFADTLAREVPFVLSPVKDCLTVDELDMLVRLHPDLTARFWGATATYDSSMDRLATGDLVLFTGKKRVQAMGRIGCKLRNQALADTLWTPDTRTGRSWINVYSILDFRRVHGLAYSDIQQAVGYKAGDRFQATRVLSPGKSAAIARLLLDTDYSDETGVPDVETSGGSARRVLLDWTREEIILAMDLYVACGAINGRPIPGQHSDQISRLSKLLRMLSAYPFDIQDETYRNSHDVYLKLMNLRAVQNTDTHGMSRISQADAAVWRDYIDNLDVLRAEAAAIRQRLAEGALIPASTTASTVEDVPIEDRNTERFMTSPSGKPREAERAEAALVYRYRDHLAGKGIAISRKKYRAGQVRPIFCDVWVQDRHALIEAKNSDGREALRMAIGQLYDYRRFHEPPVRLAVLLPHQPSSGGLALLQSAGIEAIWEHGAEFRDSANGAFV